jgi:hypothetical protein
MRPDLPGLRSEACADARNTSDIPITQADPTRPCVPGCGAIAHPGRLDDHI